MPPDPFKLFSELYTEIQKSDLEEPSAVTLATATPDGKPSARVVLLKEFDERGFVFYTNLTSRKGRELRSNPYAALCFYWEPVHHQVRVQGTVTQVAESEADAYFATRPRGSQIGAWASKQSSELEDQEALMQRFKEYEKKFSGKEVPRPDFWSGFRLTPTRMEFWKRQENRLHERTEFVRTGDGWSVTYLYP